MRRFDVRIAAFLLALCMWGGITPAFAQLATGGSGRFRNDIVWFNWSNTTPGTSGQGLTGTITRTNTQVISGNTLAITCTISNIALQRNANGTTPPPANVEPWLRTYRPGNFHGDGLDNLYNIGGTGTANSLVIGVSQGATGQRTQFDFNCSAALNGAPFPLEGLVYAEAETSINNELVEVTIPSGTPRLIDRFRSCTGPSSVATITGTTVAMSGADTTFCSNTGGPMAVLYLEGASSGRVRVGNTFGAGGISAVALGVLTSGLDLSDAPASYGQATHIIDSRFVGGEITNGQRLNDGADSVMANKVTPDVRIGASVDADTGNLSSAGATGDDANGNDDEDAFAPGTVTPIILGPGGTFTMPVICAGNASVAGWVDFNVDGDFSDTGERSAITACSGGNASLVWTVPPDFRGGASFARLRIATDASQLASAVGVATSGEVEDHPVLINFSDFADAPASYGDASHFLDGTGQLGAAATPDPGNFNDPNAAGDSDDAFPAALPNVSGVGAYTLNVPVSEVSVASRLCGFLDFDRNGSFAASERACVDVASGATSATLTWTPPAGVAYVAGQSFLRLRLGTTVTQVESPTGRANSGEVEDYPITLLPRVSLTKALSPANDTGLFNLAITPTVAPNGSAGVANVGNGGTTGLAAVAFGSTVTVSETAGTGTDLNSYASTLACVNRAGSVVAAPPGTTSGTFTIMAAGAATPATQAEIDNTDITCTVTNTRRVADLSITKSNPPGNLVSGTQTTYTITVNNAGPSAADNAVARDTPVAGLNSCAVTGCSAASGAACPLDSTTLLSTGAVIPSLPAGGVVTFTVVCNVD